MKCKCVTGEDGSCKDVDGLSCGLCRDGTLALRPKAKPLDESLYDNKRIADHVAHSIRKAREPQYPGVDLGPRNRAQAKTLAQLITNALNRDDDHGRDYS